jgi:hypothetical protein
VVLGNDPNVLDVHASSIFRVEVLTLKMEAAHTSEVLASSHTSTQYNNPRTKLVSITTHHESLKLFIITIQISERH